MKPGATPRETRAEMRAGATPVSAHTDRPSMTPAPSTLPAGKPWCAISSRVRLGMAAPGTPRKSKDTTATGSCTSQGYVSPAGGRSST
eukprot:583600-Pelagomonas_calceolata.AAC.2